MKLQFLGSIQSGYMKSQTRRFGGWDLIRALLAILYQVLRILYIFSGVMGLGRKISLGKVSYGSPTCFSMQI